jgi:hypothetical protein
MHLSDAGGGLRARQRMTRGYSASGAKMRMRAMTARACSPTVEYDASWLLDCGHTNSGACDGYPRSV